MDLSRDLSPLYIDVLFGQFYIFMTVLELFIKCLYVSDYNGIGGELRF